jgi:DNA modification methylase
MKGYFESNLATLYRGDVRAVLAELPPASIHMAVTSPPYWGLRIYDGEPLIWGGSPDCTHQWEAGVLVHDNLRYRGEGSVVSNNLNAEIRPGNEIPEQTCKLCGAWRGFYGLEPTPELYVDHTVEILRAIRRVLRPDGLVFWNIGDSYCGGNRVTDKAQGLSPDNARDLPLDYRPSRAMSGHPTIKPKDLVLIPYRVALAAQADGWVVRSDIIWTKPNGMPESVDDRPGHTHEYVFMFTMSNKAIFWTHRELPGVRTRPKADWRWLNRITGEEATAPPANWKEKIPCPECAGTGKLSFTVGFGTIEETCEACDGKGAVKLWRRFNLWEAHDYFYDNEAVRVPYTDARRPGRDIRPNDSGRNLRSVWEIPTVAYTGAHFAVFPPELPETCIKAGTSENGVCSVCGAPYSRVVRVKSNTRDRQVGIGQDSEEGRKGRAGEVATETVGFRPTCGCGIFTCESCAIVLEYDEIRGWRYGTTAEHRGDKKDLSTMPTSIYPERSAEQLLQSEMSDETRSRKTEECEGLGAESKGAYPTVPSRPSDGDQRRLRNGASPDNGGTFGEATVTERNSTPQEQHEGRQPDREFGADGKTPARQTKETNNKAGDNLSSLRAINNSTPLCPHCQKALQRTPFPRKSSIVLDCFGGSGTTAEVAQRLGRRAILIEQSIKYCDLAVGRLAQGVLPLI